MKTSLFFTYLASLFFSALMAFVYLKHLKNRRLLILAPYLLLVFIQELTLYLFRSLWLPSSNNIVYNIYKPVSILVFAIVYYNIPFMARFRKWIAWLAATYFAAILITYIFWTESIYSTNSYLTLMRGFVIICYAIFFLFSYFHLDNSTEEKHWSPLLWITIGVVIFYPVISISLTFQKHLSDYKATLYGFKLYQMIPQLMSIFMYACFSYAFYLCKKRK